MFSLGQLTFAILFTVGFITTLFLMYQKDNALHQKNFKGVKWVLLAFIGFVLFLFTVKFLLK